MRQAEDFEHLLEQYRSIWNNRLLVTGEYNSEEILIDAVKRELLDENSHPRIRKSKYEKYFLAIQRIVKSSIPEHTKLPLIEIHLKVMETISEER